MPEFITLIFSHNDLNLKLLSLQDRVKSKS